MRTKYLQRPFIYRNRESIDDFLEESQLWRDVYDRFLIVKDNNYRLKMKPLKMFNEVRYQCVRLTLDKHPEDHVWEIYLNDARNTLGWKYASELCFSMVYAILSLMKNPPVQISRFCNILSLNRLKNETYYFPAFKQFVDQQRAQGISYDIDLSTMPERPGNIGHESDTIPLCIGDSDIVFNDDAEWWKEQTHFFDQETIREIVHLWDDRKEKLEVINIVQDSWYKSSLQNDGRNIKHSTCRAEADINYFESLRERIQTKINGGLRRRDRLLPHRQTA